MGRPMIANAAGTAPRSRPSVTLLAKPPTRSLKALAAARLRATGTRPITNRFVASRSARPLERVQLSHHAPARLLTQRKTPVRAANATDGPRIELAERTCAPFSSDTTCRAVRA